MMSTDPGEWFEVFQVNGGSSMLDADEYAAWEIANGARPKVPKPDQPPQGDPADYAAAILWAVEQGRQARIAGDSGRGQQLRDFARLLQAGLDEALVSQSANEDRDAWMYAERSSKTLKQIMHALADHPEWDQLGTQQAIGQAIKRYWERHKLPPIRRKQ